MANTANLHGKVSIKIENTPVVKQSKGGAYFVGFTMLTSREIAERDDSKRKLNVFHRVVVYGDANYLTDHILPHLKNEASIFVMGEIRNTSQKLHGGFVQRLSEIVVNRSFGSIEFSDSDHLSQEAMS